MKKYKYKGKNHTQFSLSKLISEQNGVNEKTIFHWITKHLEVNDGRLNSDDIKLIINKPLRIYSKGNRNNNGIIKAKKYEYKGIGYTMKQLCKKTDLRDATIYRKLKKGLTIKDIVENSPNYKGVQKYEYKGKKYSVSEIVEITKLPRHTIYGRLNAGWTMDMVMKKNKKDIAPEDSLKTYAGIIEDMIADSFHMKRYGIIPIEQLNSVIKVSDKSYKYEIITKGEKSYLKISDSNNNNVSETSWFKTSI